MSWTDNQSIKHIKEIRDLFKVNTLVETGTFKGINARLHSNNFKKVLTVELIKEYYECAKEKLKPYSNVCIFNMNSQDFLKDFVKRYKKEKRNDYVIFYLDAHFYNPQSKPEDRFVVLKELKALKNFPNSIIIIHDFDNNLGHITYDGQPLDLNLIKKDLLNVNPNFKFFTNELSSCEIVTKEEVINRDIEGLESDFETLDNLSYVWKTPRLTYRGILYAMPEDILIKGLRKWS